PSHSTPLELTWSLIPTAIFLAIFYYGFKGFMDLAAPPDYAYEIKVVASKWRWEFVYPNQAASDTLHVPKDVPIRLLLQSDDVIHSLYVPTFRIKKDAVPKRLNTTWFKATQTGEYDLFCAEYCGTRHSQMLSKVVVQEPEAFNAWLDNAANWVASVPPIEAGAKLYTTKGCFQCHSTDGRAGTGPSFKNLFGHDVALVGGKSVLADENYLRDSILDPAGQVVAGYAAVMPTYQGRLKDAELNGLIEWIKSLSDKAPATTIELPTTHP
ncbi:MAG: cytochrome c oxidase subunit II, partial [Phycisphaeraceae bacterium]|nr:cytochrome c oxidase subunit II [Phycisphaeraceae bacterium]